MTMICGLWRRCGAAEGLAVMLDALPEPPRAADREWTDGTMALGCRERAQADQSGRPPLSDAESGLAVTASVRLDNRSELCDALGLPRAAEADFSDSELILRAYRRWGPACPEHLLGDYAFAVWDVRRETLFCVRDHIGGKPFYFARTPRGFAFASEIGSVLAAPEVDSRLDETTVALWLSPPTHLDHSSDERTFYRAVRRLLPGHSLTVDRDGVRVERWWRPEDAPSVAFASDDECAEAFLALYVQAVRDCLRAPDPIGAHLSGGLDSSGVAVLAARELRRQGRPPPQVFSWHPPPGDASGDFQHASEYGRIEAVCRREDLAPIWWRASLEDAVAFLRSDPTLGQVTGSLFLEGVVQRRAAGLGVGVILSGWGGDDAASFNGRGFYEQLLLSGRLIRLWREVSARSAHPLAHILVHVALRLVYPRASYLARNIRRTGQWPRLLPPFHFAPTRDTSVRATQLGLLLARHIGQRAEGWAEAGARLGVEYRYPLLDRRLLRFALGLPPEMYRRGPWSRWIMRHALRTVLPDEVLWNRRKEEAAVGEARHRAMLEALPEIRRMLASRSAPPGRSRYLDLGRLTESLDRTRFPRRPIPVGLLRFLDF